MNKYVAQDREFGDYFAKVSLGHIPDTFRVYKFGRGVLEGASYYTPMWDLGGQYTFPETADYVTPTSDNAGDVSGGAGAWSVYIFGLGEDKYLQSELVLMGQQSTKKFWRVFRMYVHRSGVAHNPFPNQVTDVGNNLGTITLTHAGTGLPVAGILPRKGQTLMAIFTVPKDHVALVWSADTNMGQEGDTVGMLFSRDTELPNAPWRIQGERDMYRNEVGKTWKLPSPVDELTDMVFAASGGINDNISGTFELEVRRIR